MAKYRLLRALFVRFYGVLFLFANVLSSIVSDMGKRAIGKNFKSIPRVRSKIMPMCN